MLGGLFTNAVEAVARDLAVYGYFLTPKGRLVAEARLVPFGESVLIDAPFELDDPLLAHLRRYLPPIYATVEPAAGLERLSLVGPDSGRAAKAAFDVDAERLSAADALTCIDVGGMTATIREPLEGPGLDLYVGHDPGSAWDRLRMAAVESGGGAASPEAYEVWRVERGLPERGREASLEVLPQELCRIERAVSFEKGCYTGQEVVARIHYRGHVNRYLRHLELTTADGESVSEPPAPGARLFQAEREVGKLTSVVRSPRRGIIGLGFVRREVEAGETVAVGTEEGPQAIVRTLPFTSE